MKKPLLILAGCLFAVAGAQASHLMGGNLIATHTTGSNYHLSLTYYRDTLGVPMYTQEAMNIYPITNGVVGNVQTTTLNVHLNTALSTLLLPSFPYGVEVGVFDTTISLAPGHYRILSNECCRNCAILNATNPCGESITVYTDLDVTAANDNSTPDFLNMPIAHFPINTVTNYNPLPFDVDGDSITWALNVPMSGTYSPSITSPANVAGFTTPPGNTGGPFTMNAVTGEVSWSPSATGNYIQSFVVNEYRGGVQIGSIIRDMQYVVDASTMQSNFVAVTNYSINTQGHYNYIYYTPGQQLTFKIKGITQLIDNPLTMQCDGAIFHQAAPPSFSTTPGTNSVTGTLSWTPPAGMTKDQVIAFRLRDGAHVEDFTLLMRRGSSGAGVSQAVSGINSFNVYPNPASGNISLQMDLAKDVDGDITLSNAAGQQVKTIYSGRLHLGKCVIKDDLNVAAGQYFIQVRSGGQVLHTAPVTIR